MDGDVKIRVSLDTKGVESGSSRVNKRMRSLAATIKQTFDQGTKKNALEQTISGYEEQAKAAEQSIKAEGKRITELSRLQAKMAKQGGNADRMADIDQQIFASDDRITSAQQRLNEYTERIAEAKEQLRELGNESDRPASLIERLDNRLKKLTRNIFVFQLFSKALRTMRQGMMNLLSADSAVSKSMAQIRGSLYAAFMPIYNFILPAIRTLLNFLAQLASAIANIIGGLFGTSAAANTSAGALNNQAGATGAAGGAAKKATKYLAAFDEVNQMNDDSGGGGGMGMDFSGLKETSILMKEIAKWVLAIAAGIAAWKITKALGGLKDAGVLRNLAYIIGAASAIKGAFEFIPAFIDAWKEGLTELNGSTMLKGTLELVAGLFLMFGKTGGAVGLLVTGIAWVVTGIKDYIAYGPDLENILAIFGGIALVLSAIALFTGHSVIGIGLIVAGIAMLAAGNWDEIVAALKNADDYITNMLKDNPKLLKLYEGFKSIVLAVAGAVQAIGGAIGKIFEAFDTDALTVAGDVLTGIADAITNIVNLIKKITTEGLSLDVVADIANIDFTTTAGLALVTGKLLSAIGNAIGLSGKIGVGTGAGIVFSLAAAADIAMNVVDIFNAEDAADRSDKIFELIVKALFGVAAAALTIALGGGVTALMITVPIGIKIASMIFGDSAEAAESFDEYTSGMLEAAKSTEDLKAIVAEFTGMQITDEVFNRLIPLTEAERAEVMAGDITSMKEQVMAFMGVFQERSGQEGFEEWLESLGLIQDKSASISDSLNGSLEAITDVSESATDAGTSVSELSSEIGGVPAVEVEYESVDSLADSSESAHMQIDDTVTSADNLIDSMTNMDKEAENSGETTAQAFDDMSASAEDASTDIIDDMDAAWENMSAGAKEADASIRSTFSTFASWMSTTFKNAWDGVIKVFSKGGTGFKGITTGVEKVFKSLINSMISGLNRVLNTSFGHINTALRKLRQTQIDGTYPFGSLLNISIPKIPQLAKGAVIPANNEFLAILGDQKSGTNIEAPLDTIVEAMLIAMSKSGMDGNSIGLAVRNALIGLALKVGKKELGHIAADAINTNRRDEGKLALNL